MKHLSVIVKNSLLLCSVMILLHIQRIAVAQNATFEITYSGTSAEVETAINYAADIWGTYLISDIPVKVSVHFQLLTPGLLGITFPNGIKNFSGTELSDVWYPTCLANAIAGVELNPGFVDLEIYLNSTVNWYYGTDGIVPAGKYDLVTVALHEMGHGLGIIGLANKTATEGSFGTITADLFSPLTTSFPWPDLDTLPSIFDSYIEDEDGNKLISYLNPSTDLGSQFTSNQLWFNSPKAVAANSGLRPKIYAPGVFALGSSCTHLDEATYPAGDENELMTPIGTLGAANQNPGPIVLGILDDIGWEVVEPVSVEEIYAAVEIKISPNPVVHKLYITLPDKTKNWKTEITNMQGKIVYSTDVQNLSHTLSIDAGDLISGIYIVKMLNDTELVSSKFVKL